MATTTTRLLLRKPDDTPSGGDTIDVTTDIADNMDKVDDAVGAKICTSGTRPTSTNRWDGRIIYETDTKRMYMWSAALTFWLPILAGQGSGIGPYLLGTSTDTTGEGINSSGTAASTAMWRSRVGSEANPRFTMDADGKNQWGGGGASAVDTNLYRSAADTLKTDDSFIVGANLSITGTAPWNKLDEQSPTGASFTFSSIPQTYRSLLICGSARGSTASTNVMVSMQVSGNTSAIYEAQQISSAATTVVGIEHLSQTSAPVGEMAGSSATSGACGTYHIEIPHYRSTSFWKQWTVRHSLSTGTATATMFSKAISGRIRATAAVTSVTLLAATGNFSSGTIFTLYGLF